MSEGDYLPLNQQKRVECGGGGDVWMDSKKDLLVRVLNNRVKVKLSPKWIINDWVIGRI